MSSTLKWSGILPPARPEFASVLNDLGFNKPTPIQRSTIPLFLNGKDIVAEAETGSGKTVAFVLPIVELLLRRDEPLGKRELGALVVVPTRELAAQVHGVLQTFIAPFSGSLTAGLFVGGGSREGDIALLERGCNVAVGTPGRIRDMLESFAKSSVESGLWSVREFEVLVFDEADRLMDMGFETDVSIIIGLLPKQRRTGIFSATQTREVVDLARVGLRNGVRVSANRISKNLERGVVNLPTSLRTFYHTVAYSHKLAFAVAFLESVLCSRSRESGASKAVVYVLTCAMVDYMGKVLPLASQLTQVEALTFHGRMTQKKRNAMLERFSSKELAPGKVAKILVCTDLGARGLDIPDVEYVLQFDAPQDPAFYVHRVGRTARMGRSGQALILLSPAEEAYCDLLGVRGAPVECYDAAGVKVSENDSTELFDRIRGAAAQDRALLIKQQSAYCSFARAYLEHKLPSIFRPGKLSLAELAICFGMLRIPRLKGANRFKHDDMEVFKESSVDLNSIKFKDAVRETARLARSEAEQAAKTAKKQEHKKPVAHTEPRRRVATVKRHRQADQEDADDFEREERLQRKFKRGKITKAQLEELMEADDEEQEMHGSAAGRQRTAARVTEVLGEALDTHKQRNRITKSRRRVVLRKGKRRKK